MSLKFLKTNPNSKNILKYVPGYRTDERIHKIYANIYYIFFFSALTLCFFTNIGTPDTIANLGVFLVLPFIILNFTNVNNT
ncbi:MAG: hypothetical protein ACRDAU_07970 [Clostridium sp.]